MAERALRRCLFERGELLVMRGRSGVRLDEYRERHLTQVRPNGIGAAEPVLMLGLLVNKVSAG